MALDEHNEFDELEQAGQHHNWGNNLDPWKTDLIEEYLSPGPVLDIGCGPDYIYSRFIKSITEDSVVALDKVPSFLEKDSNIECCCGTAESLPFPDDEFSSVLLFDVIEHTRDDIAIILEAIRVSNDIVLITVPTNDEGLASVGLAHSTWRDHTHRRHYTDEDIGDIIEKVSLLSNVEGIIHKKSHPTGLFAIVLAWNLIKQEKSGAFRHLHQILHHPIFWVNKISESLTPFFS